MKLIGEYTNGNYNVILYEDGTKIRETNDDEFIAKFPECMDVKITNYCDMGCPYCHENSTTEGMHGDIIQKNFINTLKPYTEMAIGGGNPLSHPDLIEFLKVLKLNNIIANITVNQKHFLDNVNLLKELSENRLIYGIGVSFMDYSDNLVNSLKLFNNAVLHIINGVVNIDKLKMLYGNGFKVLILGYKQFRKGNDFYSDIVEKNKSIIYNKLPEIINNFKVVSFDNLALTQLEVKRLLSDELWNEFFMGDDGQFTMYIDLVKQEFSRNSTSKVRYELMNDIKDMFKIVKNQ